MKTNFLNQKGITLIELLIALAIIGILAAIAYPSYRDHVRKAQRTDGQAMVTKVMQAQERFFTEQLTYTVDLKQLGFSTEGNVESEEGYYNISASQCAGGEPINNCVLITGTPKRDNDVLTLDNFGNQNW